MLRRRRRLSDAFQQVQHEVTLLVTSQLLPSFGWAVEGMSSTVTEIEDQTPLFQEIPRDQQRSTAWDKTNS